MQAKPRDTEDDSDQDSQSGSDSADASPDPSPRPTDPKSRSQDPDRQQVQPNIKQSVQAEEAVSDGLQQVAAAAASVDPDTAADIAAEALPAFPEAAKAAKSTAKLEPAFVPSQSARADRQQDSVYDRQEQPAFEQQNVNERVFEQQNVDYSAFEQQDVVNLSTDEGLEPPIANESVVAPTVSAGPKASKGMKLLCPTLCCTVMNRMQTLLAALCM